ncbi:MAG: MaoC/PaaZ C-terminal domain-containing protein [Nesterenkonia sp.]|nr:MaoC/PaaZ C-terminal domain-containing protein [Nesterenkonia sp.]
MRTTAAIEMPRLGAVYRRAAAGAALDRLRGRGATAALPERRVVARHPGADRSDVEAYRRLLGGEAFDGTHRRSLPSVFVHTMGFPVQMGLLGSEDFPLPLMGMVHLHNEVDHRRPLTVDEPVQIRVGAEGLRPHRRGAQFDVVTEVLDDSADPTSESAEVLWRGVSTYMSRAVRLTDSEGAADGGSESAGRGSAPSASDFAPPSRTALWRLGADVGRRYAEVSGDYNPIHLSAPTAKALGMPRAIVHGMYSAARMLEGREPEEAGHRWSISFAAPVKLPSAVAFSARPAGPGATEFAGWSPKSGRPHFTGRLSLGTVGTD